MTEPNILATSFLTFALIVAAEMGDKSQLVCMALAAKYKARLVFLAAVSAFVVLNLAAVIFGATLAHFIPMFWVNMIAAIMFAIFAIQSLFYDDEEEEADAVIDSRRIFISIFSLIMFAELGDKTQLAVAALSSTHSPVMVWLGATLALAFTSFIAVYVGKRWLMKVPMHTLNKGSGILFLIFSVIAFISAYQHF